MCTHSVQWHKCPIHREPGLWCGTKGALQDGKGSKRTHPDLSASASHLKKRRKLGSLGQQTLGNSAPPLLDKKKAKENVKSRYGDRPPPKGDEREGSWAWHAHSSAHARGNEGSTNSNGQLCNISASSSQVRATPPGILVSQPPKRPRLCTLTPDFSCKGNCPAVWTIDLYCPNCHG